MAAAKNLKLVFNAYKNNCNSKIKKIEDFIRANAEGLDAEKILKLKKLNGALEEQFARMETGWDTTMKDITDAQDFEELQTVVTETQTAVDKTLEDSERFIDEKSVPNPGTGTPSVGNAKIDDTLRPKDTLLRSFNLEEANLWFQKFTAYFTHNEKALPGQNLVVRRQIWPNSSKSRRVGKRHHMW